MIGTLGSALFTVSSDKVFTFDNYNLSGGGKYEEHAVIGRPAVLEFLAPELKTITFDIRLDRFLGITPEAEVAKIIEASDDGQVLPLIIGGDYKGDWVIANYAKGQVRYDGKGKIVVAVLSLTLKEHTSEFL